VVPRINRAIELLEQDQAIYYVGQHTGHVLTYPQGREDAKTWADYVNIGKTLFRHKSTDPKWWREYLARARTSRDPIVMLA
jgi:4-hydroxy-2-oxoheptanedioate aldolase